MLGQMLKKHRLELNLTQKEMAKKIGISECYYIQLERNKRKPGISVTTKLSKELNVEPGMLRRLM